MRRPCCALAALALLLTAGVSEAGERTAEVEKLSKDAAERWQKGTFAEHRKAIEALEVAARLAPRDLDVQSQLAHAYLDAGYTHDAKEQFERIAKMAPDSADGYDGLGRVWKRTWLATLDRGPLETSVRYLNEAAHRDPGRGDLWTQLAVLQLERGDTVLAARASARALAAAPDSVGPQLAAGILCYLGGRVAESESLYTGALVRMPREIAMRFRDVGPLLTGADADALAELSPAEHADAVRRFWSLSDPDPTTSVNEARVEYWTRIARASLLYSDSWAPGWDMRAELYVRYGAPEHIVFQHAGVPDAQYQKNPADGYVDHVTGSGYTHDTGLDPMWFPMHTQIWEYPQLGMSVLLQDLTVSQHYELPRSRYEEIDPVPDPAQLARSGLLATGGGHGVFALLPPGEHLLPIAAEVSAFEGEHGPHLLANVATPGAPGRALHAECVVLDSTEHEVARMARELGASRCDAATTRAGDFAFDLPPGHYRVAVSVADDDGGRGISRQPHELVPLPTALAMSDIVLVCGPIETVPVGGSVRLDPNLARRIEGDEPLLAYFEVYAMRADAGGGTKFEYEYKVHSLERDRRPWFQRMFSRPGAERISVKSAEEGAGPTRRQYLSVPARSLPPGRYRLEVTVKDHGATARREVEFEKGS
jgi:GWxTD domain-containing protein